MIFKRFFEKMQKNCKQLFAAYRHYSICLQILNRRIQLTSMVRLRVSKKLTNKLLNLQNDEGFDTIINEACIFHPTLP